MHVHATVAGVEILKSMHVHATVAEHTGYAREGKRRARLGKLLLQRSTATVGMLLPVLVGHGSGLEIDRKSLRCARAPSSVQTQLAIGPDVQKILYYRGQYSARDADAERATVDRLRANARTPSLLRSFD